MRYIRINLIAVLLLLAGNVVAQTKIYVEPRLGYGTFGMLSMKEFQQNFIEHTGVNGKATDEFGSYYQYGFNIVKDLNDETRLGLLLERGSTGGRVAYKDYSGEYRLDTPVNYTALGAVFYSQYGLANSRFRCVAGIEANVFFSKLHLEGVSRIYNSHETFQETFNSTGVGIKPFAGLEYPFLRLPTRLTLGYMASASSAFHLPGEPKAYLVRNNRNYVLEPGWSGLRINLTVSVPVFNLDETK